MVENEVNNDDQTQFAALKARTAMLLLPTAPLSCIP